MPSVFKPKGKKRYVIMWKDKEGKRRKKVAYLDRHESVALAHRLEDEANPELAHARRVLHLEKERTRRTSPVNSIGFVYFILNRPLKAIKIGFSAKHPAEGRLQGLQTSSPCRLKLLAFVRGTMAREKMLKARFAEFRLEGEWFRINPELTSLIARINRESRQPISTC
jgi:hypothetical protein